MMIDRGDPIKIHIIVIFSYPEYWSRIGYIVMNVTFHPKEL